MLYDNYANYANLVVHLSIANTNAYTCQPLADWHSNTVVLATVSGRSAARPTGTMGVPDISSPVINIRPV